MCNVRWYSYAPVTCGSAGDMGEGLQERCTEPAGASQSLSCGTDWSPVVVWYRLFGCCRVVPTDRLLSCGTDWSLVVVWYRLIACCRVVPTDRLLSCGTDWSPVVPWWTDCRVVPTDRLCWTDGCSDCCSWWLVVSDLLSIGSVASCMWVFVCLFCLSNCLPILSVLLLPVWTVSS